MKSVKSRNQAEEPMSIEDFYKEVGRYRPESDYSPWFGIDGNIVRIQKTGVTISTREGAPVNGMSDDRRRSTISLALSHALMFVRGKHKDDIRRAFIG